MREASKVVIGARSAVFAPFTKLALLLLMKSTNLPISRKKVRNIMPVMSQCKERSSTEQSVVFGSATPSLGKLCIKLNWYRRQTRKQQFVRAYYGEPRRRRRCRQLHIVDMREELKNGNRSMFSRSLYKAIEERLHKKEQIVLLLNRRGYATFVMCRTCGFVCMSAL